MIDLTIPMGAVFSDDETHRYALWRIWGRARNYLMFTGLNPSKAGSIRNDPTITRLMRRAAREGYSGLLVGNLHSLISTDPVSLLSGIVTFDAQTDEYIKEMGRLASRRLCGWGSFPAALERASSVLPLLSHPYCLGTNQNGQPKHPLYVGYGVPMVPMQGGMPNA